MFIKKGANNKRYAASQHSSFFGGLITGCHANKSFYLTGEKKLNIETPVESDREKEEADS